MHKDSEFLPVWLTEILDSFYTSSPRTRRPLKMFFSIFEYAHSCFQLQDISTIKDRSKSNWVHIYNTLFPMGVCAYFLWSILQSSDRFFSTFWYDEGADRILRGSRFKTQPKAHIILQESFFCMLWGLSLFLKQTLLKKPEICALPTLVLFTFISLLLPPLPITFWTTSEIL